MKKIEKADLVKANVAGGCCKCPCTGNSGKNGGNGF